MRTLLFTLPRESLNKTMSKYTEKIPKPLNTKFPERRSKTEAMGRYTKRQNMGVILVPAGKNIYNILSIFL